MIGDSAFYNTAVSEIVLPDSLYEIGDSAFLLYDSVECDTVPYVLRIGPNLLVPGGEAFGNLPISGFEVSEENPNLSSVSGLLTDQAQKVIYACPAGLSGTVSVPDGIFELSYDSFSNCPDVEELVIPASVVVIHDGTFDTYRRDENGERVRLPKIRCSKGSSAERFAIEHDWPYTAE